MLKRREGGTLLCFPNFLVSSIANCSSSPLFGWTCPSPSEAIMDVGWAAFTKENGSLSLEKKAKEISLL